MGERARAGQRIVDALATVPPEDAWVLGLARGGVPVAVAVAERLGAPMDVFIVRKLVVDAAAGGFGRRGVTVGAVATGGIQMIDDEVLRRHRIPDAAVAAALAEKLRELRRYEAAFRNERRKPDLRGRSVLLVDDAILTGATMRAAVAAVRRLGARRVEVAAALGARDACAAVAREANALTCLEELDGVDAVRHRWSRFEPITDDSVREALERGAARA
jgi:putative phosphoribosyl transferase